MMYSFRQLIYRNKHVPWVRSFLLICTSLTASRWHEGSREIKNLAILTSCFVTVLLPFNGAAIFLVHNLNWPNEMVKFKLYKTYIIIEPVVPDLASAYTPASQLLGTSHHCPFSLLPPSCQASQGGINKRTFAKHKHAETTKIVSQADAFEF